MKCRFVHKETGYAYDAAVGVLEKGELEKWSFSEKRYIVRTGSIIRSRVSIPLFIKRDDKIYYPRLHVIRDFEGILQKETFLFECGYFSNGKALFKPVYNEDKDTCEEDFLNYMKAQNYIY